MTAPFRISNVKINLIKLNQGMIGFASCVLNKQIRISGIAIHQKADGNGYRLTYPTRKSGDKVFDLCHPITRQASHALETAIFAHLKDVMTSMENSNAGYNGVGSADEQF